MMPKQLEKTEKGLAPLACLTKGDELRVRARKCRRAAASTNAAPTARMIREMAAEYDAEAVQADAEDRCLAEMVKH